MSNDNETKTEDTGELILTCPKCAADATGLGGQCGRCEGDGGWRSSGGYWDPDEWNDCVYCDGTGRRAECPECRHEGAEGDFETETIRRRLEAANPRPIDGPVLSIALIGEE